jgi:hypothetical protein
MAIRISNLASEAIFKKEKKIKKSHALHFDII